MKRLRFINYKIGHIEMADQQDFNEQSETLDQAFRGEESEFSEDEQLKIIDQDSWSDESEFSDDKPASRKKSKPKKIHKKCYIDESNSDPDDYNIVKNLDIKRNMYTIIRNVDVKRINLKEARAVLRILQQMNKLVGACEFR